MQLFELKCEDRLSIGDEIEAIQLQDIRLKDKKVLEKNLEDLIIEYPQLLNYDDCDIASRETPELLFISRQIRAINNKSSDILALDSDGSLVTIEVKRDAKDERGRREALEFQAIRYAASHRKLTVKRIIGLYARYLWDGEHAAGVDEYTQEEEAKHRSLATMKLCEHLSDEHLSVTDLDGLDKRIDPAERQRIYLVAADFEEDVTSACAWLRDHKLDIACFCLRPYRIGNVYALQRERLIPPPELDDFLSDTKDQFGQASGRSDDSLRSKCVKPVHASWGIGKEREEYDCRSWKAFLEKTVSKALAVGFPIETLPMKKRTADGKLAELPPDYDRTIAFEKQGLYIDCNASAELIKKWVGTIREQMKQPRGFITVELAKGDVIEI